jgi:hypothetical protein
MSQLGLPAPGAPATSGSVAAVLVNLRDTVKWMIAAASAVAAVLVAGLQIKDVNSLAGESTGRLVGALAAALLALLLVLLVIVGAVRVLATPRLSVRDLSAREVKAVGNPLVVRLEPVSDELIQSLRERRTYLLGQHQSIFAFYNNYVAVADALAKLRQGNAVQFDGRNFDPQNDQDGAALAALVLQAERDAERLEDAAQLIETEIRFKRLSDRLIVGGVLFAIAVLAFAWLAGTKPTDDALVTKPSLVQIYIKNAAAAGLAPGCHASELRAIALGGTFVHPTLVTQAAPGCPSTIIYDGSGVIVVPIVNTPAPAASDHDSSQPRTWWPPERHSHESEPGRAPNSSANLGFEDS